MTDKGSVNIVKFDGANYSMWKFGILFPSEAKELIGYIEDSEKEPAKEEKPDD